tara:strand:- start:687 stop:818 length:132 start_codon:yes stop_codon:yes gene_type:complete
MIEKLKQIIKNFIKKHIVDEDPREDDGRYDALLKELSDEKKKN